MVQTPFPPPCANGPRHGSRIFVLRCASTRACGSASSHRRSYSTAPPRVPWLHTPMPSSEVNGRRPRTCAMDTWARRASARTMMASSSPHPAHHEAPAVPLFGGFTGRGRHWTGRLPICTVRGITEARHPPRHTPVRAPTASPQSPYNLLYVRPVPSNFELWRGKPSPLLSCRRAQSSHAPARTSGRRACQNKLKAIGGIRGRCPHRHKTLSRNSSLVGFAGLRKLGPFCPWIPFVYD